MILSDDGRKGVAHYRGGHPVHVVEERGDSVLGLLIGLQAVDKSALEESKLALVEGLAKRIEVLLLDWGASKRSGVVTIRKISKKKRTAARPPKA